MYMRGATPQSVAGLAAAAAAAGACALWYLRYRWRVQRALAARVGLEAAHSLFAQIDVDDDGTISREELDVWLRKRPTWAASHGIRGVESVFAALVGGNNQAKIDKSSFVAWLSRLNRSPPGLADVDDDVVHLSGTKLGAYGAVRFLAHNRYLQKCLNEDDHEAVIGQMRARDLLTLEAAPEWFAFPEHSLRYVFPDGTERGNFLTCVDGFVTPEEARRIIARGCLIKSRGTPSPPAVAWWRWRYAVTALATRAPDKPHSKALGRHGASSDVAAADERVGDVSYTGRSGTIAFDHAYAFGWALLRRARPWLPVEIHEGPDRRWVLHGLNPRIRLVNYEDGNRFGMHFDLRRWGIDSAVDENGVPITDPARLNAPDAEEEGQHALITLNLYLNTPSEPSESFGGGRIIIHQVAQGPRADTGAPSTEQWEDGEDTMTRAEWRACGCPANNQQTFHNLESFAVAPVAGRMLIFGQGRLGGIAHEAEAVRISHERMGDQKWILRADAVYQLSRIVADS